MNNIQRNFKQKAGLRKGYSLGGEVDPLEMGNDRIREINRMSGLSQRQRGIALAGVADKMAEQGATTDLKSLMGSGYSGLSQRQKLGLGNAQFKNDLTAMQANQPKPLAAPAAATPAVPALTPTDPFAGNEASDYWDKQATLNKQIRDLQESRIAQAKTDGTLTGTQEQLDAMNAVSPSSQARRTNPLNTLAQYNTGGETGDKYVLSAEATKKLGLRANVRGPGGPTDDMVPGEKYGAPGTALSDGEVIGEPSELLDAISKKLTGKEPGPTMVQRKGLRAGFARSGLTPEQVAWNKRLSPFDTTPRGAPEAMKFAAQPNAAAIEKATVRQLTPTRAEKLYEMGARAGEAAKNAPGLGATAKTVAGTALRNAPVLYGAYQTLNDPLKFEPEDPASEASTRWAKTKSVAANVGDVATKGLDFLAMPFNWVGDKLGVTEDDGSPMEYDTYNKFFRRGMAKLGGRPVPKKNFDVVQPTTPEERAAAVAERAAAEAKADPTKGLRQALIERVYGEGAAVPEGAKYARQADTNAHTLTWNSKENGVFANDRPVTDGREAFKLKARPQNGGGIVSIRQPDGTFKNVIIGPSEYTKADGSKTSNYSESARYAQGLRDRANLFKQDRVLSRMRAERDAFDPSITDPRVRNQGLRKLSGLIAGEQLAGQKALALAKAGPSAIDIVRLMLDMADKAADNQRADDAANDQYSTSRINRLKSRLGEDKDGKRLAAALNYLDTNYKTRPGEDAANDEQEGLNAFMMEEALNKAGQHTLTPDEATKGVDKSQWKKRSATLGDAFRVGRGDRYEGPGGKVVFESDLLDMPVAYLKIFRDRLPKAQQAEFNKKYNLD